MTTKAQTYNVDIADVEYLRHGDTPLLARLFKPQGTGPFPIMLELHGGAWVRGNREIGNAANEALAKTGVIVAALDFRTQDPYPNSLADIHYAVRWAKSQAASWNGNPDRIGAMGTSSGAPGYAAGHAPQRLPLRCAAIPGRLWIGGRFPGLCHYGLTRHRSAGTLSLCQRPPVGLHSARGHGRADSSHA